MGSKKKTLDTLKLLVTDGCNLSCIYCVPEYQTKKSQKKKGLKQIELVRIVKGLISQGIVNIDFRGGEPLTKKWIFSFLEEMINTQSLNRISLMTNGVVLKDCVADLYHLGIREIGVHLDSLNFEKYMKPKN